MLFMYCVYETNLSPLAAAAATMDPVVPHQMKKRKVVVDRDKHEEEAEVGKPGKKRVTRVLVRSGRV